MKKTSQIEVGRFQVGTEYSQSSAGGCALGDVEEGMACGEQWRVLVDGRGRGREGQETTAVLAGRVLNNVLRSRAFDRRQKVTPAIE